MRDLSFWTVISKNFVLKVQRTDSTSSTGPYGEYAPASSTKGRCYSPRMSEEKSRLKDEEFYNFINFFTTLFILQL